MPIGNLWPSTRNSGKYPSRRRRLLGRKNRSDNDLPQQAPQQPLQIPSAQQQTVVHLPDNVRTILIAGTPECWNLSTCAESFVPEACDASLLTYASSHGSEVTPGSLTIDEEESCHHDSPRQNSSRLNDELDWLRIGKPSSSPKKKSAKSQQMRHTSKEVSPLKGPSSMVVMYQSPSRQLGSPQDAVNMWLQSVDGLMKSKEMANFVTSTRDVVKVAGGLAVKTAFLPVTVPLHVACATKDFVGWTVHQALSQTTGAILQLANGEEHRRLQQSNSPTPSSDETANSKPESKEKHKGSNPLEGLLQLVPVVLHHAGKVKDEIGSAVIGLVTPPQTKKLADQSESTSSRDKEALDRLRIPVMAPEKKVDPPVVVVAAATQKPTKSGATKADFSKYLLRVDDLAILESGETKLVVLYIDLSTDFRDDTLLDYSLEALASQGIALATSCAPSIPPATTLDDTQVEWKPEGATTKLLRKKRNQTAERWDEIIRSEVLIWSGNFRKGFGGSSIHTQYPMFLARGIVARMSPREFLELLWNNDRTAEYNNFCMGRKDAVLINDKVLSSPDVHSGTKVVRSETRVPFTGLSVSLCTIMHCCALPGGPQEGYVIISRSLVSGQAGTHKSECSSIHKPKSEILWGVNLLRSVPGHPGQTELTSVSQVASTMVPRFLSQKIGVMGVEDFFRSVRNVPKAVSSPVTSTRPTSAPCVSV